MEFRGPIHGGSGGCGARELEPASGGSRGPSKELEIIAAAAVRALRMGGQGSAGRRPSSEELEGCPTSSAVECHLSGLTD